MSFRRVSLGDVVGRVLVGARLPRLGDCADGDPGIIPSSGGHPHGQEPLRLLRGFSLALIVGIDRDPSLRSRMLPPESCSLSDTFNSLPLTSCLAKSFHIPSKNWLTSFSAESSVLRAFW